MRVVTVRVFCVLTGSLTSTLYVRKMAPPFNVVTQVMRATENTLPCAWWGNPLTPCKHCHKGLLDQHWRDDMDFTWFSRRDGVFSHELTHRILPRNISHLFISIIVTNVQSKYGYAIVSTLVISQLQCGDPAVQSAPTLYMFE